MRDQFVGIVFYALHKDTVTIDAFVLRWVRCAVLSETVGCVRVSIHNLFRCVMRSTLGLLVLRLAA